MGKMYRKDVDNRIYIGLMGWTERFGGNATGEIVNHWRERRNRKDFSPKAGRIIRRL